MAIALRIKISWIEALQSERRKRREDTTGGSEREIGRVQSRSGGTAVAQDPRTREGGVEGEGDVNNPTHGARACIYLNS